MLLPEWDWASPASCSSFLLTPNLWNVFSRDFPVNWKMKLILVCSFHSDTKDFHPHDLCALIFSQQWEFNKQCWKALRARCHQKDPDWMSGAETQRSRLFDFLWKRTAIFFRHENHISFEDPTFFTNDSLRFLALRRTKRTPDVHVSCFFIAFCLLRPTPLFLDF